MDGREAWALGGLRLARFLNDVQAPVRLVEGLSDRQHAEFEIGRMWAPQVEAIFVATKPAKHR